MTLMGLDPFRDFERFTGRTVGGRQAPRAIPMTAFRRGDQVFAYLDLPGVMPEDVDLTVERNVVSIRAERHPAHHDGDEVIVDERPYGVFLRQVFLGDSLDLDKMTASYDRGELCLTIPVSERAKPRRIPLAASQQEPQRLTAAAAGEGDTEKNTAGSS
jgi:HSP20 family protein